MFHRMRKLRRNVGTSKRMYIYKDSYNKSLARSFHFHYFHKLKHHPKFHASAAIFIGQIAQIAKNSLWFFLRYNENDNWSWRWDFFCQIIIICFFIFTSFAECAFFGDILLCLTSVAIEFFIQNHNVSCFFFTSYDLLTQVDVFALKVNAFKSLIIWSNSKHIFAFTIRSAINSSYWFECVSCVSTWNEWDIKSLQLKT